MYIYLIQNMINGKCYVGQTIQNVNERWARHRHDARAGKAHPLYASIRKYGIDNFSFSIVEEHSCIAELNDAEIFYIEYLDTIRGGYNIEAGGRNSRMSDETKKKLSLANRGKPGRPQSEATKKKCSLANIGRPKSEETKRKISESLKRSKCHRQL